MSRSKRWHGIEKVFREKHSYLILIIMSLGVIGPGTVATYYKAFGQKFIYNDLYLGSVG
jgi:hypothetical protein